MSFLRRGWRYILGLPRVYSIGGAIIVVVLVVVVVHVATRAPAEAALAPAVSHVTVASVAGLSSTNGPLPVTGKVTSLNQANILAQSSGEITSLRVALGSRVGAGQVLATFENSSQAAAVQQAEGSYEAATAALAKATGSTAANAGISSSQAANSAANSATAAATAMQSVFAAIDDAVHTKADVMFSNPRSITPHFSLSIPDNQLSITLQNERGQIEATIDDVNKHASDTGGNIDANADAINADGQIVITFLNNLVAAANQAVTSQTVSPATLASYQTSAGAARSEVVSALLALSSAKNAYDTAQSGAQSAANSATVGSNSDIAASNANVKQALGALNAARANLEKTIVRSPISGTVVSLPVTRGDFVSSFAQVAVVSNPGALEIQANVTPTDAKTLVVGGKATIGAGNIAGVITAIAPALDPTTGKIQVKVGITGSATTITDGDTVNVLLTRTTTSNTNGAATNTTSSAISIPIAAAKITPQGAVIFTVASSTLLSHSITLGAVQGSQVVVTAGLTPDMDIVTDARGLTDGQQVVVDTQ